MTKGMIIRIIVVSLMVLILILYLLHEDEDPDDEYYYNIEYQVDIITNNSNQSYNIICPVPVLFNGNLSKINEELKVENGNVSYTIEDTLYGYGLKVSGKGSCKIIIALEKNDPYNLDYKYPVLSLDKHYIEYNTYAINQNTAEYYCNYSSIINDSVFVNVSLNIDSYYLEDGIGGGYTQNQSLSGDVNRGWNILHGRKLASIS